MRFESLLFYTPESNFHLGNCWQVCVSVFKAEGRTLMLYLESCLVHLPLGVLPLHVSPMLSPVCLYQLLLSSVVSQEEKGISCGLVELDFLKCSVGFPFMRAQTKVAESKNQLNAACIQ